MNSEDAKLRQQNACGVELNDVLELFTSSSITIEEKNKAAYILSSCTIENTKNRQKIGLYNAGAALKTLISMLDVKRGKQNVIDGAAMAAEAIWILSFNNANNHNFFLSHGAISSLSEVVQYDNENIVGRSLSRLRIAKMWAAAALQNLAASYCKTDTGHCWWDYDHHLFLHPESPLRNSLGGMAREIILKDTDLISYLKDAVCRQGPILTKPWPSEAAIGDINNATDQITTWAYVGAIKNLALSEQDTTGVFEDVKDCLCDLSYSEDWLVRFFEH